MKRVENVFLLHIYVMKIGTAVMDLMNRRVCAVSLHLDGTFSVIFLRRNGPSILHCFLLYPTAFAVDILFGFNERH